MWTVIIWTIVEFILVAIWAKLGAGTVEERFQEDLRNEEN